MANSPLAQPLADLQAKLALAKNVDGKTAVEMFAEVRAVLSQMRELIDAAEQTLDDAEAQALIASVE